MNSIINNTDFQFTFESGIVSGFSKNIVNNTYSSGGGGMLIRGNGYIAPPTTHTESIHHVDFFLEKKNEKESDISLEGHNINLRDGQHITLIWGKKQTASLNYLISIYNHNTDKHHFVTNERTVELLGLTNKNFSIPLFVSVIMVFIPFGLPILIINYIRNRILNKKRIMCISKINNSVMTISPNNLLK